jgi:hypothetical protein
MFTDEATPHDETDGTGGDGDEFWGEVISRYTRAEALEDGSLVDVSETAREAGIRFPVAVTRAVWNAYVALTPAARRAGNDERGRLWDLVWLLRCGIARQRDESGFLYELLVVTDSIQPSRVKLRAECGPGDNGEPVITVLLPHED